MAKKNKKADETTPEVTSNENTVNETPVEPTAEITPEVEPAAELEVEPTMADAPAEAEVEPTAELEVEPTDEEEMIEVVFEDEELVVVEEPIIESKSQKHMFEEAIAKTPFVIYQNNIMICHSNPYLVIKTEDKYFEINYKKYSYNGIEIKQK